MKKIQFDSTIAKISGYTFASIFNAVISFISVPIVTALFPASEYGQISLFISYQSIILSFVSLGMDQSMARYYYEPPEGNTSKGLTTICFSISMSAYIITMCICLLNWEKVSYLILDEKSKYVVICLMLGLFSQLLLRYLNQSSRLQSDIKLYITQSVSITISTKLSYIIVASHSKNSVAAITSIVMFSLLLAVIFISFNFKRTFALPQRVNRIVLKKIIYFGLPQIPVQLLSTLNTSISQIMLRSYVNYAAVGIFSTAITITNAISIIQSSINTIWAPYVYENYKQKQKTIIVIHHLVSLVMLSMGLALCLSEDLIYLLLVDKQYWASKQYFPLLIISPVAYTISETLGIGIKLAEKAYLSIIVYALGFGGNILLCLLLIPYIGALGAAISSAIASIIMLIVKSFLGEVHYRCSDSYKKLIFGFSVFCVSILIAVILYNSIVRYIALLIALTIILIVYRKEIIYLSRRFLAL